MVLKTFTLLLFLQCLILAESVRYVIQEWSKESSGKLILSCSDQCREDVTCSVVWSLNRRVISHVINLTIDSRSEYGQYTCSIRIGYVYIMLKTVLLIPPGKNLAN